MQVAQYIDLTKKNLEDIFHINHKWSRCTWLLLHQEYSGHNGETLYLTCLIQLYSFHFFFMLNAVFRNLSDKTCYMMTSSNGNFFRVTSHLCGEFTGHRGTPLTNASDAELDVFFDLHLNKRLSKQSRRRWFENPSRSSWRHCNVIIRKISLSGEC